MSKNNYRDIQIAELVHEYWSYNKRSQYFMFLSYESCSATRKLPRLNSEPNGGGFDKEYEGGYGAKVSFGQLLKSEKSILKLNSPPGGEWLQSEEQWKLSKRRKSRPEQGWQVSCFCWCCCGSEQVGEAPFYGHCPKGDGGVKACHDG